MAKLQYSQYGLKVDISYISYNNIVFQDFFTFEKLPDENPVWLLECNHFYQSAVFPQNLKRSKPSSNTKALKVFFKKNGRSF